MAVDPDPMYGLTMSCADLGMHGDRCSRPATCTCTCHQKEGGR